MALEPEADFPLPLRMEMGVDFVDQNDPAALDAELSIDALGQIVCPVGMVTNRSVDGATI